MTGGPGAWIERALHRIDEEHLATASFEVANEGATGEKRGFLTLAVKQDTGHAKGHLIYFSTSTNPWGERNLKR
jgi:hypothetical protein